MKFGLELHRHVVPEWDQYYIPYNLYKRMIKTIPQDSKLDLQAWELFYKLIQEKLQVQAEFLTSQGATFQVRETEILAWHGLNHNIPDLPAGAFHDVYDVERSFLLDSYRELYRDVAKLAWFCRVNDEAVDRTFAKLKRTPQVDGEWFGQLQAQWSTLRGAKRNEEDGRCTGSEWLYRTAERIRAIMLDLANGSRDQHVSPAEVVESRLERLFARLMQIITDSRSFSPDVIFPNKHHDLREVVSLSCAKGAELRLDKAFNAVWRCLEVKVDLKRHVDLLCELVMFSIVYGLWTSACGRLRETLSEGGSLTEGASSLLITFMSRAHPHTHASAAVHGEKTQDGLAEKYESEILEPWNVVAPCFLRFKSDADLEVARKNGWIQTFRYAAMRGLSKMCQGILSTAGEEPMIGDFLSPDGCGQTALHHAVIGGHVQTAATILEICESCSGSQEGKSFAQDSAFTKLLGDLIILALKLQSDAMLQLLLSRNLGIDLAQCRSAGGENILHLSGRLGRADYVRLFLAHTQKAATQSAGLPTEAATTTLVNEPEPARGWTPLHIACARGHSEIVQLLLGMGAKEAKPDQLGWTAKEIAAYRGFLGVACLFQTSTVQTGEAPLPHALRITPRINPLANVTREPVLQPNENVLVIGIGSNQERNKIDPVDLTMFPYVQHHPFDLSFLAIEVSVLGQKTEPKLFCLPLLADDRLDPFVFRYEEKLRDNGTGGKPTFPPLPQLIFKLVLLRHRGGTVRSGDDDDQSPSYVLLGSGTSILGDERLSDGVPPRQFLVREQTVKILGRDSLEMIGSLLFTHLHVRPFQGGGTTERKPFELFPEQERRVEDSGIGERSKKGKERRPRLCGHRGSGMNSARTNHLQIGENTIRSLCAASELGADFVEFDVQVTKDLEPVLYHDFSLSESGTDVAVHDVSFAQYKYANEVQTPAASSFVGSDLSDLKESGPTPQARARSRSLEASHEDGAWQIQDRLKHTFHYRDQGYKANKRGHSIQDSFATLKEVLRGVPVGVGLDVEFKYPRLHETLSANTAPVGIEINTFVDAVLARLTSPTQESESDTPHNVLLSSFTPEICILLSLKLPSTSYPVMLISNAGKIPVIDYELRVSSLQVAIKFARRWGLRGIVLACESFLLCPRLVGVAKRFEKPAEMWTQEGAGLVVASYGVGNSDKGNVLAQVQAGIDMIITDRVGAIAQALKEYDSRAKTLE